MSTTELRRRIKKAIDGLPAERLVSLSDYVEFLRQASLIKRVAEAEKDLAAGKGVQWRRVRSDV